MTVSLPGPAAPDQQVGGGSTHREHNCFVSAIDRFHKVVLVSNAADGRSMTRTCAPLAYAAETVGELREPRYCIWDFEGGSEDGRRIIALTAEEIVSIRPTWECFRPSDFGPLNSVWHHPHDWDEFS
jgi:hypothetical protein